MFVNVGDAPLTARLDFNAARHGLSGSKFTATKITADGPGETVAVRAVLQRELTFPPRTAWAWEIAPQD